MAVDHALGWSFCCAAVPSAMGQLCGCHCAVTFDAVRHPAQIEQAKWIQEVDASVPARASRFVHLAFAYTNRCGSAFCLLDIVVDGVVA